MNAPIMVSVLCTAYNHEKFLCDALDGILRQKTNFRYELIIHDDASTDKTTDIIKEYEKKYPEVIVPIYQKENQYNLTRIYPTYLFPAVRGKYVAFCEGDDYWTDDEKLQKQFDFMEENEEFSMCFHNAMKLNWETGETCALDTFPRSGCYSQEEHIKTGLGNAFPAFASYFIRSEYLKTIPDFFVKSNVLDYPLRQYFSGKGKIYYMDEIMSVYRISTPQSYMKKTVTNETFYNNYVLDMLYFFEQLDKYTEFRFHAILAEKLASDYYGYCSSIDRQEGMVKAKEKGLDLTVIEEIYDIIDENTLDKEILALRDASDRLLIFGTSRLAMICKRQLDRHNIDFEGFVVSDGQMKTDSFCGKTVYSISEMMSRFSKPGVILAVQPVNREIVTSNLKRAGIEAVCAPYEVPGKDKFNENM